MSEYVRYINFPSFILVHQTAEGLYQIFGLAIYTLLFHCTRQKNKLRTLNFGSRLQFMTILLFEKISALEFAVKFSVEIRCFRDLQNL